MKKIAVRHTYPSATAIPHTLLAPALFSTFAHSCIVAPLLYNLFVSKLFSNPLLLIYLFIPLFATNLLIPDEQQYVYLADAFLKGNFSFIELPPSIADLSYFEGKFFWPLGPFPAIILIPFVLFFKTGFSQGFIQTPLNIINFWLVYKISTTLNLPKNKAVWLAIFFIFGSVYTTVATIPFSWYFAQIIAVTLILFSIYEFLTKKRWLLIGIAIALAILTRTLLAITSLFFLIYLLKKPFRMQNLAIFLLPIIFSLFLICAYNYLRFGNWLESGYTFQLVPEQSAKRRAVGLFSLKHIPANLYYMLLKTPDPVFADNSHVLKPPYLKYNDYGMSILLFSPILFLLLKSSLKEHLMKISLITMLAILVPVVTYYGIGYKQIGYRYALDFFPFLLILLIPAVKKTSTFHLQILTGLGVFITWFFLFERFSGV